MYKNQINRIQVCPFPSFNGAYAPMKLTIKSNFNQKKVAMVGYNLKFEVFC